MMQRKSWVPALGMYYHYDPDEQILLFDDGVTYTLDEAMILARGKARGKAILAVHRVKKIFKGVIMEKDGECPDPDWKDDPVSVRTGKKPVIRTEGPKDWKMSVEQLDLFDGSSCK